MPFKEKAIVRHRLRPDWGVGRVLLRSEEYLQIDFTGGGLKKLKTVIADEHLLAASDDEFKASKPAAKPSRAKAAKPAASAVAAGIKPAATKAPAAKRTRGLA